MKNHLGFQLSFINKLSSHWDSFEMTQGALSFMILLLLHSRSFLEHGKRLMSLIYSLLWILLHNTYMTNYELCISKKMCPQFNFQIKHFLKKNEVI